MAKDPFKARLTGIKSEVEKRENALAKLQVRLRADPYDADLRRQVQDAKAALIPFLDEKAEIQRAISRMTGGKQHRVEM
jgi:hypothetical protein